MLICFCFVFDHTVNILSNFLALDRGQRRFDYRSNLLFGCAGLLEDSNPTDRVYQALPDIGH
jgi:hypothetical protein